MDGACVVHFDQCVVERFEFNLFFKGVKFGLVIAFDAQRENHILLFIYIYIYIYIFQGIYIYIPFQNIEFDFETH